MLGLHQRGTVIVVASRRPNVELGRTPWRRVVGRIPRHGTVTESRLGAEDLGSPGRVVTPPCRGLR